VGHRHRPRCTCVGGRGAQRSGRDCSRKGVKIVGFELFGAECSRFSRLPFEPVILGKDLIIIYFTARGTLTALTVDLPLTVDRKKYVVRKLLTSSVWRAVQTKNPLNESSCVQGQSYGSTTDFAGNGVQEEHCFEPPPDTQPCRSPRWAERSARRATSSAHSSTDCTTDCTTAN
jgi:hypothetical protein